MELYEFEEHTATIAKRIGATERLGRTDPMSSLFNLGSLGIYQQISTLNNMNQMSNSQPTFLILIASYNF